MADAWLKRRLGDPRFASERNVTPWHSVGPRFEGEYQTYNFAYKKDSPAEAKKEEPKKKKRKKTESGGSATASSSSSASEGGTKKKKKGRCWTGYKPAKGKEPYSEGSCVKA